MTAASITFSPMIAGINNQKLALLGLFLKSLRESRSIALPTIVDFVYLSDSTVNLPFENVFDLDSILHLLSLYGIEVRDSSDIILSPHELFGQGAESVSGVFMPRGGEESRLILDFFKFAIPSRTIQDAISTLRSEMTDPDLVCQFRIEKDWIRHCARRLDHKLNGIEDHSIGYKEILAKLYSTFGGNKIVYATCDTTMLVDSFSDMSKYAEDSYQFRLINKDFFPGFSRLCVASNTIRSIIDFELAVDASVYIGMTRSTFSNLAAFTKFCRTGASVRNHYIYNCLGPLVQPRRDEGTTPTAASAVVATRNSALNSGGSMTTLRETRTPQSQLEINKTVEFFKKTSGHAGSPWSANYDPALKQFDISGAIEELTFEAGKPLLGKVLYTSVLTDLHKELDPEVYLEIGIYKGETLTLAPSGSLVVGVDPDPKGSAIAMASDRIRIMKMTSDEFFATRAEGLFADRALELCFIDGLHVFEYALRDFIGCERFGTKDTVVCLHDIVPRHLSEVTRRRIAASWTGDVWRLALLLKKYRPDLEIQCLDAKPTGVAVIRGLSPKNTQLIDNYDAYVAEFLAVSPVAFFRDRDAMLNLQALV